MLGASGGGGGDQQQIQIAAYRRGTPSIAAKHAHALEAGPLAALALGPSLPRLVYPEEPEARSDKAAPACPTDAG